jgi:hypothetical protein
MFTHLDLIAYGSAALVITGWIAILAFAGLKGWHGWLDYKRAELDLTLREARGGGSGGHPSAATRIDVADLKERIRKLEAIASGVDL